MPRTSTAASASESTPATAPHSDWSTARRSDRSTVRPYDHIYRESIIADHAPSSWPYGAWRDVLSRLRAALPSIRAAQESAAAQDMSRVEPDWRDAFFFDSNGRYVGDVSAHLLTDVADSVSHYLNQRFRSNLYTWDIRRRVERLVGFPILRSVYDRRWYPAIYMRELDESGTYVTYIQYENHYAECANCGASSLINDLDEDGYCESCHPEDDVDGDGEDDVDGDGEDASYGAIRSYGDNVLRVLPAKFLTVDGEPVERKRQLFMGVELECEPRDSAREAARHVGRLVKGWAVLKHDSSLGDGGFEIVSVPASLRYHRYAWARLLTHPDTPKLIESWRSGRCGLHVHIDRSYMSDLVYGRLAAFIGHPDNMDLIVAIAGRNSEAWARLVAKRLTTGRSKRIVRRTVDGTIGEGGIERMPIVYGSHGEALGISPRNDGHTAELRIFRGNISYRGFMRAVEFTHAAVMFAGQTSNTRLSSADFMRYMAAPEQRRNYPALSDWLAVKFPEVVGKEGFTRVATRFAVAETTPAGLLVYRTPSEAALLSAVSPEG